MFTIAREISLYFSMGLTFSYFAYTQFTEYLSSHLLPSLIFLQPQNKKLFTKINKNYQYKKTPKNNYKNTTLRHIVIKPNIKGYYNERRANQITRDNFRSLSRDRCIKSVKHIAILEMRNGKK